MTLLPTKEIGFALVLVNPILDTLSLQLVNENAVAVDAVLEIITLSKFHTLSVGFVNDTLMKRVIEPDIVPVRILPSNVDLCMSMLSKSTTVYG